ncbi:CLK4-associating serine/arginine rich protein [Apis mellifera]|uniref:CLK4-associating serine/arginine rich protein n=1 Tax=Apis mellifera TaxID=7460 RepID=A0A7M7FZK4_APIME|nr:CLK4-associating serine/arginine rich protein [Apis mellifera]|eukprot:XP_001121363.2 CLK4-associating serine/arginine rich protein [Apis mellifera]
MSFSVKKTGGRMWHEARKQEKKIRGMLVDYRRRAERRRDYYEKIKSDPTQFLQLHGRPCKIHLDPAIATAGDSPANMMPWQGNEDNLIDRFDVRAHLDWIPEAPDSIDVDIALTSEDRHINYERYRIIVQNEFLGVTEEKFLHQIHLEEQFGSSTKLDAARDKKKSCNNVAIGYNYETEEPISETVKSLDIVISDEKADDEDSDIDLDICVDVSQIEPSQAHEMNLVAQKYGLLGADYFSFLTQDFEEAETLRQARKQEEEKAMYSGRRSRRERRAFREKKMIGRVMSPPSYAARESPEYNPYRKSSSKSRSRSISPINTGQITYITSFGGEEETYGSSSHVTSSNSKKVNYSHLRHRRSDSPALNERTVNRKLSKSRSRSCSRSIKSKSYRNHDRKRSTSRSRSRRTRSRHRKNTRSRTRSRSKRSRTRSESRSRYRSFTRSRSRTISRSKTRSRSHSRPKRSRSSCSSSISRSRSKSRSKSHNRSHSRDSYRRRHYSPSKSVSKSRSRTKSQSRSRSRSRSQSRCKRSHSIENKMPALPRYYGRRGKSSSLELELSDNEEKIAAPTPKPTITNTTSMNKPKAGLSTNSGGGHKSLKITPQERLKKKMQALLNRQYKADKKAEQLRIEKMEQQRQDREDEIREMSLKLRRKQRERRHRYEGHSSDSHSSISRTPSPGRSPRIIRRERKERDMRNFENDRERERDRERDKRDDREKFRTESRRRYRDSPLRSLSPRNSRGLVDY